jgi:hypothetical protein
VLLDGKPVSPVIVLPGSHGSQRPIATAESWDGGVIGCNRFSYRFTGLAAATRLGGRWGAHPGPRHSLLFRGGAVNHRGRAPLRAALSGRVAVAAQAVSDSEPRVNAAVIDLRASER